MVGGTKDPPNGPAVAGTIFTAVIVYAVCIPVLHIGSQENPIYYDKESQANKGIIGLCCLLRPSSVSALQRKPEGGDSTIVAMKVCGSSEQRAACIVGNGGLWDRRMEFQNSFGLYKRLLRCHLLGCISVSVGRLNPTIIILFGPISLFQIG
jgi:hypothetical protein